MQLQTSRNTQKMPLIKRYFDSSAFLNSNITILQKVQSSTKIRVRVETLTQLSDVGASRLKAL